MIVVTVAIVVAGAVVAIMLGAARSSFDAATIVLLLLIAAVGWLAIAVARKSTGGSVRPASCTRCGGLISESAPYCKHCGAPVEP